MTIKRTVYGIGYKDRGDVGRFKPKTYAAWYNMMSRCYSEKIHAKYPQYKDCEVDPHWHYFKNFAEWYEGNEFAGLGYHLDKDLIAKGNKIYCEELCCLIPHDLNTLITISYKDSGLSGTYKSNGGKKWVARATFKGKQINFGSFSTELEAHQAYLRHKENLVRSSAKEWFERIESRAYEALITWTYPS